MRREIGAALLVVAACGGKLVPDDATPPTRRVNVDPGYLSPDTTALSAASAHKFVTCSYDGLGIATNGYGGEAGFAATVNASYVSRLALAGVRLTQADVDACVAQLNAADCLDETPACNFTGVLPTDYVCVDDIQCTSGFCAGSPIAPDGSSGQGCGICKSYLAVGDACATTGNLDIDLYLPPCADGLACFGGTCQSVVKVGASCADAPCDGYTYCGPAKTCAPPVPVGAACVDGTTWCAPGADCVATACMLPLPVKGVELGGDCTAVAGRQVVCVTSECDPATSRCVPVPPAAPITPNPAIFLYCPDIVAARRFD